MNMDKYNTKSERLTPHATGNAELSADLLEWLRGKLAKAEQSVVAREQAEATYNSGSDESWAEAAAMHPATAGKPMKKSERIKAAARERSIAAKCRHEVAMFKAVLSAIERAKADMIPFSEALQRESDKASESWQEIIDACVEELWEQLPCTKEKARHIILAAIEHSHATQPKRSDKPREWTEDRVEQILQNHGTKGMAEVHNEELAAERRRREQAERSAQAWQDDARAGKMIQKGLHTELLSAQAAIEEHNKNAIDTDECLCPIEVDLSALQRHDEEVKTKSQMQQMDKDDAMWSEKLAEVRKPMVEALQCAEYAMTHPESNQQFALNAVRDAIGQANDALAKVKE